MWLILVILQLPLALMVIYLDVLSVAAVLWRHKAAPVPDHCRLAVLVPAHNEELLLPRLLRSLSALEYPPDLYDIHVVADNCTDRTASVAIAGGATVHVRQDTGLVGKGYALRWLLAQIRASGTVYDAYIIVDADSTLSTNFLAAMNCRLTRGEQVVQSYYGVLNRAGSWSSALRYVALALYNGLRPRGRDALGLSAGLRGNGMCLSTQVVDCFGWEAFTLAEDVELHLQLVAGGVKVSYAGEASVLGEMPTSLRQAHTQHVRWERGRLQMLRTFGPRLLRQGLYRRDLPALDALFEQVVPPFSVLTSITVLAFLMAGLSGATVPWLVASFILIGQTTYVVTGLLLVRADPQIYLALFRAPFYMIWKLGIYAAAAAHMGNTRWVRTARSPRET